MVVMGITWLIGVLVFHQALLFVAYIFTIVTAFQVRDFRPQLIASPNISGDLFLTNCCMTVTNFPYGACVVILPSHCQDAFLSSEVLNLVVYLMFYRVQIKTCSLVAVIQAA